MIAVAPSIAVVPVRTPTLPPATHTNTYIVGDGELWVFDPASPYEDEQSLLNAALAARTSRGERVERIVLTHHHEDHVAGAEALRDAQSTPDRRVRIAAHAETARRVADRIVVDDIWIDGEARECGGRRLVAHHTPGHAPGHLVFHDAASGTIIAGDMVAGIGTILVDPADGDLAQYLASLAAMDRLGADVLLPSHGPALPHATQVIAFYVAHRHQRTEQIRQALDRLGAASAADLAPHVYADLPIAAQRVGTAQIQSHLLWMKRHGLARPIRGEDRWEIDRA